MSLRSILVVGFLAACVLSAFAGSYTFTSINVPPAYFNSGVDGINDTGQVILTYFSLSGDIGLMDSGGVVTPIVDPLAIVNNSMSPSGTDLSGINDAGRIIGYYTGTGGPEGFLYSGGTFTTISDPLANANGTYA